MRGDLEEEVKVKLANHSVKRDVRRSASGRSQVTTMLWGHSLHMVTEDFFTFEQSVFSFR